MNFIDELPLIAALILAIFVASALILVASFLLGLPLRRRERASLFLDVLELALQTGSKLEATIGQFAESHERSLGRKFLTLAAYLRGGMPLIVALKALPGFLPPQVVGMLEAGAAAGNLPKILPAARRTLQEGMSGARSVVNYAVYPPGVWFLLGGLAFLFARIFPKFAEIFKDLTTGLPAVQVPPTFVFLSRYGIAIDLILHLFLFALAVYLIGYLLGPHFTPEFWKPVRDRLVLFLPWRRKRLYRDFSMMLALLLDAEVAEKEALTLAARSTDNQRFIRWSGQVLDRLQEGVPLTAALKAIEPGGEFEWHLANAIRSGHGFERALAGWHEALDARAFQQEQATSQVISTALIFFNAFIVGLFAVAIFQWLAGTITNLALW